MNMRTLLTQWMTRAYSDSNSVEGLKLIHFLNTGEWYSTLQSVLRQD